LRRILVALIIAPLTCDAERDPEGADMDEYDDRALLADPPGIQRTAAQPGRPPADRHFVTALACGLEVLACFRSGDKTLGNLEIARRCGLPKSTVSRLTTTLKRLGYLIQIEDSGKYRLGTATLSLGSAALTLSLDVGSRIPIATSAIGRAWLAAAPEADRRDALERIEELDQVAWPSIRAGIDKACEEHRTLGVTCSFGEWQADVNGIARAFQPGGGLPVMAINVGGPSSSLSPEFLLGEVRPRLLALVERLAPQAGEG
jgi:DNA-binding IclR family transcriptional regulator